MSDLSPAAPSRWIPLVTVVLGLLSLAGVLIASLLTVGAWRAQVDVAIADLLKRMDRAEINQATDRPVLIGMQKDIAYLVERGRREDERRDRAAH